MRKTSIQQDLCLIVSIVENIIGETLQSWKEMEKAQKLIQIQVWPGLNFDPLTIPVNMDTVLSSREYVYCCSFAVHGRIGNE